MFYRVLAGFTGLTETEALNSALVLLVVGFGSTGCFVIQKSIQCFSSNCCHRA